MGDDDVDGRRGGASGSRGGASGARGRMDDVGVSGEYGGGGDVKWGEKFEWRVMGEVGGGCCCVGGLGDDGRVVERFGARGESVVVVVFVVV